MTIAQQIVCASAIAGVFAGAALAEDLDCRRFIPATGATVAVRCEDENPRVVTPAAQTPQAGKALLGLTLSPLTQDLKEAYGIEQKINGVLVTKVDLNSEAEERGITRGDVILETNQEAVLSPEDMARSVDNAAKYGRKSISLLLASPGGKIEVISLSLGA